MDIFGDDTEFTDIRMVQKVVNMFDGRPHMQRIITCGLFGMEYSEELDDTGEDDFDHWAHGSFHGYGRLPGRSNDRGLNRNPMSSSVYPPPLHYYASAHEASQPAVKVNSRDNDTERKTRLLQESKKGKNKAEKKRLKKQKQKERKQREKLEKDKKQNPARDEEDKDDAQQPEAEDGGAAADKYEDDTGSGVKLSASAKDTDTSDSSENESSDEDAKNDSNDSEELDMTSTFVSKAALIAKRKLEQKPRAEKKEKKKTPGKEERKAVADKPTQDEEVDKKDSAALSSSAFEENVKISTNLANIGNKYASSGDFNMAVKYFTDAIKYNPTEFKLFGNRSFCFEKLREYDKALTDAELSLGICPGWVKGLFRKGRALAGLKRYEEAAQAFRTVLKMDSSCAEAAQELMRVQITQLMGFGFTREQSSNALIIHGTVEKSLEVLSTLNGRPGVTQNGAVPPAQVVNVSGVSPVLSANTSPAAAAARYQEAPKQKLINKPLAPVQNMSNVPNQPKPVYTPSMKASDDDGRPPPELFPVWIGNLNYPVPESTIVNLFSKVGVVYSAKVLVTKRCAFVNFTKQEDCDEAIRRFHGYELNGMKIAVRYPDRIPPGMGISRSALRAENPQDENVGNRELDDGRNAVGNRRFVRPYKPVQNHRGNY